MLALIVSGHGIVGLLFWLIGIVLVFAIVAYILRVIGAPEIAFKALYVIAAIICLLVVVDFFFGGGDTVIVR